jgi:hypothetical protein
MFFQWHGEILADNLAGVACETGAPLFPRVPWGVCRAERKNKRGTKLQIIVP